MILVKSDQPLVSRDHVDGKLQIICETKTVISDDERVAQDDDAACAMRIVNQQRAPAIFKMRDGSRRVQPPVGVNGFGRCGGRCGRWQRWRRRLIFVRIFFIFIGGWSRAGWRDRLRGVRRRDIDRRRKTRRLNRLDVACQDARLRSAHERDARCHFCGVAGAHVAGE